MIMQLVNVVKIISDNSIKFSNGTITKEIPVEASAFKCESIKGYMLIVKVGDVSFKIGSQREEVRCFKSIDSLIKTLKDAGIQKLTVCGY